VREREKERERMEIDGLREREDMLSCLDRDLVLLLVLTRKSIILRIIILI